MYATGSPAARRLAISSNELRTEKGKARCGFASTLASEKPLAAARRRRASRGSIPLEASASSMVKRFLRVLRSRSFFGERGELLGLVLVRQRFDDLVELAVHDAIDLVEREVDA